MKKLNRWLCICLTLMLVMGLFAGCVKDRDIDTDAGDGAQIEEPNKDVADDSEDENEGPKEVVLKISTMFGGTDPVTETYKKALEDFMDQNPHINIEDESMTSEGDGYRTKVNTDYSLGNDPDIVFFYARADAEPIINARKVISYDVIWQEYSEVGAYITDGIKDKWQ